MYTIISVVFTTKKLNENDIANKRHYAFVCDNDNVKIDDLITGHCGGNAYSTPMQVIDKYKSDSRSTYDINGKQTALKTLEVDTINGRIPYETSKVVNAVEVRNTNNKINTEMKKNNMFAGIADKYKSQYIPEREEGVKMSLDGTMCVAVGDEYVGMKSDGTLTSYPREVLIDVPVYSINKPSNQVQIGDVIKNGKSYGRVMMRNADGSLKIMSYTGYKHDKQEVQDFLLGQAMTRVLINMFNFDATGFNPLFFMLGDEENEFDMKDLLMLSMMSGGKNLFGSTNGMNPLMLMALTDKNNGEGGNDLMNVMLMSQMMGGQNPFSGITPVAPAQTAPAAVDAASFVAALKANPELLKQIKDELNKE